MTLADLTSVIIDVRFGAGRGWLLLRWRAFTLGVGLCVSSLIQRTVFNRRQVVDFPAARWTLPPKPGILSVSLKRP